MKLKRFAPKKKLAQAMVEFAIVLPILLLLLYGVLEAGRLLFMYSTIVTATRQAVRYGTATGIGTGSAVPRYQDCIGIRQAAIKADYLRAFNHNTTTNDDIKIWRDQGTVDRTDDIPICLAGETTASWPSGLPDNESRIIVEVTGHFNMIVRLVPFGTRNIRTYSARSLLVSIAIDVTPPGGPTATPTVTDTPTATPTLTPSETSTPSETPNPAWTPSFTPPPTNTLPPTATGTPTLPPTMTTTGTITPSPTAVSTSVVGCDSVHITTSVLQQSGNTMFMDITNTNSYPLTVKDIFVVWNNDRGHQFGGDKTLKLQSIQLPAGNTFWSIPEPWQSGPSFGITPSTTVTIAGNGATSRIIFTFHQSYTTWDDTEEIDISLSTPGCEFFVIRRTRQQ